MRPVVALVAAMLAGEAVAPQPVQAPAPQPVQARAPQPVQSLPDPVRVTLAEVTYVHPLFRALDQAPKLAERTNPQDLDTRQPLVLAVHLLETGRVAEAVPIEPPLKGLAAPLAGLVPRWRFTPAKKGGQPVPTWATYSIDLAISLEKGIFAAFSLEPLRKDDPLVPVIRDTSGDAWMARYPREVEPKDPAAVSIEDVDVLPSPEKTPWSFDAARVRARTTALVEVSEQGVVARFLPTGETEPLLGLWLRQFASKWRFTPALSGGRPVSCWMVLDATLDYTLDSAKKKSERVVKKNLRSTRPS